MSGYLEVKYPFRSNLGLNPFKSWKRQWCILRPSPTCSGGGSLAVYCSEAGAPAGTVELPSGGVVRRAKSRSRPHAFAVFSEEDPRKPRILLAAPTLGDAQVWMEKIRDLLSGRKRLGTEALLKDSYSVTVVATELSRKTGITGDSLLTVSSSGLFVSRAQKLDCVLEWKHISDVLLASEASDKSKACLLTVNSEYQNGGGELKFSSPLASELVSAVRSGIKEHSTGRGAKKLSKSEGDLRSPQPADVEGEIRRSSWYSGPSEVSLDDIDLVMSKEASRMPRGPLARCAAAPRLAPPAHDDSMCDRRSLVSIASGIYEEIPDLPLTEVPEPTEPVESTESAESSELYCPMGRDMPDGVCRMLGDPPPVGSNEEPMYESVVECVYATMRRARAPPLPPRKPFGSNKVGSSWNCRAGAAAAGGVTRHGSLGALPVGAAHAHGGTHTLPKPDKTKQPFSVFRKRLKSDSRVSSSPKSDTAKENKDVETKKKKFDFTPTRDIFKSFKVSRKMKHKAQPGLGKVETKSCEFLDETEPVSCARCARSVECLDATDASDATDGLDGPDAPDLALEFNDLAVTTLSLPQEIVDLIILGREQFKVRLKEAGEAHYLPMAPGQYMVMSPRGHSA